MTTKPKKALRGRPPLKNGDRLKEGDGERLRDALAQRGLSQAALSRLTGIRTQWITQILAGERALGREDLRALGKVGISADYLLGTARVLLPVGSTRTPTAIEADLAVKLEQEITVIHPPQVPGETGPFRWVVSGPAVLKAVTKSLSEDAVRAINRRRQRAREMGRFYRNIAAALKLSDFVSAQARTHPEEVTKGTFDAAEFLLAALQASTGEDWDSADDDRLLLIPESRVHQTLTAVRDV
jgi:transcriptional regulator with XRE-family HTH domain